MDATNLSLNDITENKLIPGFRYISEVDYRWFEQGPFISPEMYIPQFDNETPYDWGIFALDPIALEAACALGLPVVLVDWQNKFRPVTVEPGSEDAVEVWIDLSEYPYQEKEQILDKINNDGLSPIQDKQDPNSIFLYVAPSTEVGLAMKYKDVFKLARYFALASREEFRNPAYDYASLPPGKGWGEYVNHNIGPSPVTYWLERTAPTKIKDVLQEALLEDKWEEIKAPDSGSLLDGNYQYDRDEEWLGLGPQTVGQYMPDLAEEAYERAMDHIDSYINHITRTNRDITS